MNWTDLVQSPLIEILNWAGDEPWAEAMAACAQDAEWHAEGDVWTHTKMVCQQLEELSEWGGLSRLEQAILTCTALFHDSAKPLTSQVDPQTGRISSPNHAVRGEQLARCVLREMDCPLGVREQISALVRYHGRPAFLLERKEPAHEVVRLSWLLNNNLLYLFAKADTRGRTTQSMSRPEETLHYWKATAEENDCLHQPFAFAHSHARFVFFRQSQPNLYYVPHEEFSCRVTMVAGLPGSGKDTFLSKHHRNLPTVSLDALRREMGVDPTDNQGQVIQRARERCRELLRQGQDFAFNATNLLRQTRRKWIDLFADYGAQIDIVYLEPHWSRLLEQNRQRAEVVPEKVVRKLANACQPPNWSETHGLQLLDG